MVAELTSIVLYKYIHKLENFGKTMHKHKCMLGRIQQNGNEIYAMTKMRPYSIKHTNTHTRKVAHNRKLFPNKFMVILARFFELLAGDQIHKQWAFDLHYIFGLHSHKVAIHFRLRRLLFCPFRKKVLTDCMACWPVVAVQS